MTRTMCKDDGSRLLPEELGHIAFKTMELSMALQRTGLYEDAKNLNDCATWYLRMSRKLRDGAKNEESA